MPTEPFEDWPSPTTEAVLRTRVQNRTRVILGQKALTVLLAVTMVVLAVFLDADDGEQSSDLRMVDEPSSPVTTPPPFSLPRLRQPSARPGGPVEGAAPAESTSAAERRGDSAYPSSHRLTPFRPLLLDDPVGDANSAYCQAGEECVLRDPQSATYGATSYPTVDLLGIDVTCHSDVLRLTWVLLDPDRPLPGSPAMGATSVYYKAAVWAGRSPTRALTVTVNRVLPSKHLDVWGTYSYTSGGYYELSHAIQVRLEGPRVVAEIPFAALDEAAEAEGIPVAEDGARMTVFFDAQATLRNAGPGTSLESGNGAGDGVQRRDTLRFCR